MSLIHHTEDGCDVGADGRLVLTPTQTQERAADPDRSPASRLSPPSANSNRHSAGGHRVSNLPDHISLKIRILEDPHIRSLTVSVFRKYPLHELQCPCGLQEADFLAFLRSTYPQLAPDKPFEMFLTDGTRRLQPLKAKALTPEEIYAAAKSFGAGNSSVYIQLKTPEEPPASDELMQPPLRIAAAAAAAASSPSDQTAPHARLSPTTVSPAKRKCDRYEDTGPRANVLLKIRMLEDSQISVLTNSVFKRYPLHKLQCPCGLEEADFLSLLRSTFPQLAADEPFDVLKSDISKRLRPVKVNALTPDELLKAAGNYSIYIRLKATNDHNHLLQSDEADAEDSSPASDQTELGSKATSDGTTPDKPQSSELQNHIDFKIRVLEDSQSEILKSELYRNHPVQELQCPLGLQEADFMDLLRSTFPQLAAHESFVVYKTGRSKKLRRLQISTLTPEKIHKSFKYKKPSIVIHPKAQDGSKSSVEKTLQRTDGAAKHSPSPTEQTGRDNGVDVQQRDDSPQINCETEAAGDRVSGRPWSLRSLIPSEGEHVGVDPSVRTGQSETMRNNQHPNVPEWKAAGNSEVTLLCKVCRVSRGSMKMLVKHAWSHVGDPEGRCGVCGERSAELKSHLQNYLKTHSCDICGKSFISYSGLKGHVARHGGVRPYSCQTCHKVFTNTAALHNHKWVHEMDVTHKTHPHEKTLSHLETLSRHIVRHSPYTEVQAKPNTCQLCGCTFHTSKKLQLHLRNHHTTTGYACTKCDKLFVRKAHLVIHKRIHMRPKPYKCPVCDKGFCQSRNVKRHMKTHKVEENFPLEGSDL